eukprot:IDg23614t1
MRVLARHAESAEMNRALRHGAVPRAVLFLNQARQNVQYRSKDILAECKVARTRDMSVRLILSAIEFSEVYVE